VLNGYAIISRENAAILVHKYIELWEAFLSGESTPELIRAAGGLVWRKNGLNWEILIIHRPRYDDWALPKGKLKKNEGWEQAALREVAEETGYQVSLESLAGDLFYYVSGRPKIVLFWNMTSIRQIPEADRLSDSPDEGDQVKWLSIPQALERITYDDEKELVKRVAARFTYT
jgi:8-oxo-dGTP pyrophosphatase MutT (NUDIX family)